MRLSIIRNTDRGTFGIRQVRNFGRSTMARMLACARTFFTWPAQHGAGRYQADLTSRLALSAAASPRALDRLLESVKSLVDVAVVAKPVHYRLAHAPARAS